MTFCIIHSGIKYRLNDKLKLNLNECYQCGKCTAGCPLSEDMDIPPNQIIRMMQYGNPQNDDKIIKSYSIWLCLSCQTCFARCPQEIDLPAVMDYLREKSIKEKKVNPRAKKILAFHKNFLKSVKQNGRLHEAGFIIGYKLDTMAFFQDVMLVPSLISKGKLHFLPRKLKSQNQIKKIFKSLNHPK